MDEARALDQTFGAGAHLLETLAGNDQRWFRDSLVPVLGAARGQDVPRRPGNVPAPGNTKELFWRSNDLYAGLLQGKQGSQARDLLDRVMRAADTAEQNGRGDARELLREFAWRYSEEHGSFRDLLQDAAKADARSFRMQRRDQESGELARRMARDLLRAEFESRYGSLDAHLAEIRLAARQRVDGKIEEVANKQLKRINKFDEQLYSASEGLVGREIERGTPRGAGGSRYAESMQREARAQQAIGAIRASWSSAAAGSACAAGPPGRPASSPTPFWAP